MDLGLEGKRAIVTGASRGIGYETARLFLEGVGLITRGGTAVSVTTTAVVENEMSEEARAERIREIREAGVQRRMYYARREGE